MEILKQVGLSYLAIALVVFFLAFVATVMEHRPSRRMTLGDAVFMSVAWPAVAAFFIWTFASDAWAGLNRQRFRF